MKNKTTYTAISRHPNIHSSLFSTILQYCLKLKESKVVQIPTSGLNNRISEAIDIYKISDTCFINKDTPVSIILITDNKDDIEKDGENSYKHEDVNIDSIIRMDYIDLDNFFVSIRDSAELPKKHPLKPVINNYDFTKLPEFFIKEVMPFFTKDKQEDPIVKYFLDGFMCNYINFNVIPELLFHPIGYKIFISECISNGRTIAEYKKGIINDVLRTSDVITIVGKEVLLCNNTLITPKDIENKSQDFLMVYEIVPKKDKKDLYVDYVDPITMRSNKDLDVKGMILESSILNFTVYTIKENESAIKLVSAFGGIGDEKCAQFSIDIIDTIDVLDFLLPYEVTEHMEFLCHRSDHNNTSGYAYYNALKYYQGYKNARIINRVEYELISKRIKIEEYIDSIMVDILGKKAFTTDNCLIINDPFNFVIHRCGLDIISFTLKSFVIEKLLNEFNMDDYVQPDHLMSTINNEKCIIIDSVYRDTLDYVHSLRNKIDNNDYDALIYYYSESLIEKKINVNNIKSDDPKIDYIVQNWLSYNTDCISFEIRNIKTNTFKYQQILSNKHISYLQGNDGIDYIRFSLNIKVIKTESMVDKTKIRNIDSDTVTILSNIDDIDSIVKIYKHPSVKQKGRITSISFNWNIDFIAKLLSHVFDPNVEYFDDTSIPVKYPKEMLDPEKRKEIINSMLSDIEFLLSKPETKISAF